MNKDPYQILGVDRSATQEEIKKSFRSKAKQLHPDKNPGNKQAEEQFKDLGSAYEILSNKDKKEQYDRFGHVERGNGVRPMSMDDIFSHFGDMFARNIDNDFFGQRSQQHNLNRDRGTNLRIKVKLTLKEILFGCQKKIKLNKFVKCDDCEGSGGKNQTTCPNCKGKGRLINVQRTILGQMRQESICFTCDGTGEIIKDKCTNCSGEGITKKEEYFIIDIPKGVEEGMQLSMSGHGNSGRRNGPNGDLLILIEEIKDNILVRDGYNILYNLDLNMIDACLGVEIEVPTILNKVKINIEPGTQPGKVLKLKGKGLPDVNYDQFGDQLINVNVIIPKQLTSEEQELLKKLKLSKNFVNSTYK